MILNILRNIVAIIIATVAFLFLYFIINFNIYLSCIAGFLGYLATLLVIPAPKSKLSVDLNDPELEKRAAKIIAFCREELKGIEKINRKIKNNEVSQKIRKIVKIGWDITEDFKKDPKDIKRAKQFISYYLEATVKIVKRYHYLSKDRDINPDVADSLKKVENLLDMIEEAYKKQFAKLLEDDLIDLDSEVELLERTIKMEGM